MISSEQERLDKQHARHRDDCDDKEEHLEAQLDKILRMQKIINDKNLPDRRRVDLIQASS